jgi:hypothetical protein
MNRVKAGVLISLLISATVIDPAAHAISSTPQSPRPAVAPRPSCGISRWPIP